LRFAGKDGTEDYEEIGHSSTATEMLDKYLIGTYAVSNHYSFIDISTLLCIIDIHSMITLDLRMNIQCLNAN